MLTPKGVIYLIACTLFVALMHVGVCPVLAQGEGENQVIDAGDEEQIARVIDGSDEEGRSAIYVRHAVIQGQVFLASEREKSEEAPANDVTVTVRDIENNDVICETVTDEEGAYELPMIDVGRYYLFLGALRLNLIVEPEIEIGEELPKIIIFIIPEEMARKK